MAVKMTDPATKADIAIVKADIALLQSDVASIKSDVSLLKSDVASTKADIASLRGDVERSKEELKLHFDFVAENLTNNFRGAFSDRTEWLKDKVGQHGEEIVRIKHFLRLR